jgi:ABC-type polysaccharide/polyol phosphate transport system ATPase subunit
MEPPVIDCRDISKTFVRHVVPVSMLQERMLKPRLRRNTVRIDALHPVSLTVAKGEWVGLYGPNGSGKTTLLKIIAGIVRQDRGSVRLQGRTSCFFELGTGFHPERRADENIYLHGLLRGMSARDIHSMTDQIIDTAGVRSHAELPLKCYSTGMQMRLSFAAAAQVDADVYLFDEILAVGDAAFQEQCWLHLASLKKRGKTALMVSHHLGELERICDRIVLLEKGRVTGTQAVTK